MHIYRVHVCVYVCVLRACMVWCVCVHVGVYVQVVCVGVCTLRQGSTHLRLALTHFRLSQRSKQSTSRRVGNSQPYPASSGTPAQKVAP